MRTTRNTRWLAPSFTVLAAALLSSACGSPLSPTAPEVPLAAAAGDDGGKASMSGAHANLLFCRPCPLAMDPLRVPPNKLATATAYLFNAGDAPAGLVDIAVSLVGADGRRIGVSELEAPALRPGERTALSLRILVPADAPEGRYRLEVVADPANRIHESDETDNTLLSSESLSVVR